MSNSASKVLAIALSDRMSLDRLVSTYTPDAFPKAYRDLAKVVFDLGKAKVKVTKDVLSDHLKEQKASSDNIIAVEKAYTDCTTGTADPGEFNFYFDKLKKERADRILRDTLSGMDEEENPIQEGGKAVSSIPELLNNAKEPYEAAKRLKNAVVEIESLTQTDPIIRVNMRDRWQDKITEYNERKHDKSKAIGTLTGFGPFDDMTRGIHPGELFLFAGRPGTGKSIALVNAVKTMFRNGKSVMIFSLEMPFEQYEDRFMSCYAQLNAKRMLLGALTAEEETRLATTWQQVGTAENQLEIIDFPQVSSFRIETELVRALDKFVPDVVVVDYLGIMKPNDKGSVADWEAQGRIAEELRQVGRLYKVPIVSAVQLNRSKDKNADTDRLSRSDIIAQTADAIVMINDKSGDENELSDQMKFTVIKNRKGESAFEFEMYKNFETITIENLSTYKSSLEAMLGSVA